MSRHDTSTTWGRDKPHPNGTALSSNLARYCVWATDLVTPETSPDGNDREVSGVTRSVAHTQYLARYCVWATDLVTPETSLSFPSGEVSGVTRSVAHTQYL